ncbi:MAG: hypothetical protein FJ100_23130 [Deltaproteobacteria bacterium]|nr:hypothetical protein [Deltaproteobacteria bacterium]
MRDHPNVHAAAGKRAVQRAIAATRPHLLAPGTVVFVELAATGKPPVAADVKAILPTFRARVRYKDTVRTRNVGGLVTTRPEVRPTATELSAASADGQPAADWQLSAARLLFGLNAEDDMWPESIAKSHYGRFSGRIACNAAIEVIEREQRRFVVGTQGHHRWVFALRPQGSPKPSAVEHYVAQDANVLARRTGTLVTWGDGDQTGGELAGRKFYLHQPDIIGHLANAEANEEELRDSAQHCPRLKYLSTASSRFHCTVRFHNLRPWELGALLLALQPTAEGVRTVEFGVLGSSGPVARYFDKLRSGVAAPEMMHKLGRGRAYGLGSIEARIDSVALVERSADGAALLAPPAVGREELFRKMFGALARKIARCLPAAADRQEWVNRVLVNWVDVHLFRNRTPAAGYPALAERCARSSQEIIAYHNQVRALHLSGRKSGPPRNRPAIPVLYGILPEPDPDW